MQTKHLVLEPGDVRGLQGPCSTGPRDSLSPVSAGATRASSPRAALKCRCCSARALGGSNGQLSQVGPGPLQTPAPEPQPPPPASTPNPIPLWLAAPPPRATLTDWRPSLGPQPHPSRDTWGTLAQEAGHVGQFVCHWQGRGTLRDPPRPPKQIAPEAPCPPATADCGSLFLTRSRQVVTHVPFPLRTCCRWRLGQGWSPDGLHDVHFNKRKPSLGAPGPGGHRPGASGTQNTDDGEPPAWCLEPEDSWMGRVPLGPPGGGGGGGEGVTSLPQRRGRGCAVTRSPAFHRGQLGSHSSSVRHQGEPVGHRLLHCA
ncbi:transmembrane protein 11, mitochondrial isoform X3 [Tursiops truncatus]|uniref:Transmembrane protein 11, mitochondrial isoform X2 n=1 Tax=Tursiops truncatus TaxID=9739 RepID=A0A6J3QPX8_TURTR|nr:transmembrane protein 11, mitochondrial isoform X2 [Tursiops truncatus]